MSNQNMWIVLYSLFILTKLVINDPMQSQLFNKNNINIVFQLIFNLILHGASADIKMLEISVNLLGSMLSNDEMFEYMANYPKLKKSVTKLLPLLLVFDSHNKQSCKCLQILKLLNIIMESSKMPPIIIQLLNFNRYISVVMKLCLYHTNTDYITDFKVAVYATKLLLTILKSEYLNDHQNENNIFSIFLAKSHHHPHYNLSDNANSNASTSSINLSSLGCNEEFVAELKTMYFVEDACNVLFGHTASNGNNIMKSLCFTGHIDDYSQLNDSQKYVTYFIELINVLCKESHQFKARFVELLNIPDLAYFLCPNKNYRSNGEPNQIYLSLLNLICVK